MSSASNITISLQSTVSSKGINDKKSVENMGSDDDMNAEGFDRALESARSDSYLDRQRVAAEGFYE